MMAFWLTRNDGDAKRTENSVTRELEQGISAMVAAVADDEKRIGVFSTGEQIAIALVLDRPDLFPNGHTILEAIERLGYVWTQAALRVQRNRE
jgi:hypothetical protein